MTSKAVTQTDFYFQNRSTNQTAKQPSDVKSSFGQMMNQATSQAANQKRTSAVKETSLQRNAEQVKVKRNSNDSKVKQNETLTSATKKESREINKTIEDNTKELVEKIADELGVSIDDVEKAMETLGMQNAELLQANALANLVVELSGETDLLALATNEELYSSLQTLEQLVETICGEVEEAFSINPEELQELIAKQENATQGMETMVDSKQQELSKEVSNAELVNSDVLEETNQNAGILVGDDEISEDVVDPKKLSENKTLVQVVGNQTETNETPEETGNQEQDILLNPLQKEAGTQAENQSMMQQKASTSAPEETGSQEVKKDALPEFMQSFSNQIGEKLDAALQQVKIPLETPDTERIMRQVMNQMKVHIGANITEMEMQLHPASLGTVNLQVAYKDGALTAQFTAQNETVKAAIESQIVQLRENLNEQGIKVEAIEVTIASHEFERNLSKGNEGQQEQTDSGKQGRRKLNLDSMDSLEELQLEEAERIAVQLMKESGNTVDFTA